jgi:cytochrome c biogenesis protein CcmG, thiol:disulfide interchange protein DsbE
VNSQGRIAILGGSGLAVAMGLMWWGLSSHAQTVQVGDKLPPIQLTALSGESVDLASLAGKPMLVDFFTTWCGPCQEEAPLLQRVALEEAGKVQVVLIDRGETRTQVDHFASQYGLNKPLILLDTNDKWASRLLVTGQPETFYVDASGIIQSHVNHELTWQGLESLIHTPDHIKS